MGDKVVLYSMLAVAFSPWMTFRRLVHAGLAVFWLLSYGGNAYIERCRARPGFGTKHRAVSRAEETNQLLHEAEANRDWGELGPARGELCEPDQIPKTQIQYTERPGDCRRRSRARMRATNSRL